MQGSASQAQRTTWRLLRRFFSLVGAIALVMIPGLVVTAGPAGATSSTFIPQTKFEIDGNIPVNSTGDWGDPIGSGFYGPYTTVDGYPSTGITQWSTGSDPCGAADNTSLSGNLNGSWTPDGNPPNKKADLCSAGNAIEVVDVNGQYNYIFYGYWSKDPAGSGDLSVYYVLEGGATGRPGDILIKFDYDPAKAGDTSVSALKWTGTAWVTYATVTNPKYFDYAIGSNEWPSIGGAEGANGNTFAEFAINLTATGILSQAECASFTSTGVVTQTGNSETATMQDYIAFTDNQAKINTCSTFIVNKKTSPEGTPGGPFGYTLYQKDGKAVHDATLTGDGDDPKEPDTNTKSIVGTLTVPTDATDTWKNVIASPDYLLKETTLPDGWATKSYSCTYYDPFETDSTKATKTVSWKPGQTQPTFQIPSSTLTDVTTTCTIVNETSSLVIEKKGSGDPEADFTRSTPPRRSTSRRSASERRPAPSRSRPEPRSRSLRTSRRTPILPG